MLAPLTAPYVDTCARQLCWTLGLGPLDALASCPIDLTCPVGPTRLELRVLGASHQALLTAPRGDCSETVACLPGRDGYLPDAAAEELDGWTYAFSATVGTYPRAPFRDRVERLLRAARGRRDTLAGRFAGSPYAATVVAADVTGAADGRVRWRTWHTYPRTDDGEASRGRPDDVHNHDVHNDGGQIVATRTEVVLR